MAPRFKSSVIAGVYDTLHSHAIYDDETIEPELVKLLQALDEDLFTAGYEASDAVEKAASDLDNVLAELDADEEAEDEEEEGNEEPPTAGGDVESTDPKEF